MALWLYDFTGFMPLSPSPPGFFSLNDHEHHTGRSQTDAKL
jgi:hypothetical protein